MKISDRIVRSRVRLLNNLPFFGILLLKLEIIEDDSLGTFATNGKYIKYSPSFAEELNELELNWVMVHEVLHCVFGHIWRRKDRVPSIWNIACDYAIHSHMMTYLKEVAEASKFLQMPRCGLLYDPVFDGKCAEEIYDEIIDDLGGLDSLLDKLLDSHEGWSDSYGDGDSDEQNGERDWKASSVSAAEQANSKKPGLMGGSLLASIGKLNKPKVNWKDLVADSISSVIADYSFLPPDRRHSSFGLLLPDFNVVKDELKVIFWIDTSGSMSDSDIKEVYSEIVGCVQQFENLECFVGCFDASVSEPTPVSGINDIMDNVGEARIKLVGRGGTDFYNPIKYTVDNYTDEEVKCIIMLTDGYASFDGLPDTGNMDLLWLINNNRVEPTVGRYASIRDYD